MRQEIIDRALKCIDEVYPEGNSLNVLHLPLDDFLDEAGRRIVRTAPLHALGSGRDMSRSELRPNPDGSGRVMLPADFVRLMSFRMAGWVRPAVLAIRQSDPAYRRQSHSVTRGGPAKPVVALCDGDTVLEYYSLPAGIEHRIAEARYFGYSGIGSDYPPLLIDATVWQLAALVLSSINDANGAAVAQSRTNEYLGLL